MFSSLFVPMIGFCSHTRKLTITVVFGLAVLLPFVVSAAATIPAGCATPGDCDELTPTFSNLTVKGAFSGALIMQNGAGDNYFMGRVGIGTATPNAFLDLQFNGGGGIWMTSFRNHPLGGNITINHARGTKESPLPLNSMDAAGNIYFYGRHSDGVDKILAQIEGGYVSDNRGSLSFRVNNTPDHVLSMATNASFLNAVGIGYSVSQTAASTNGRLLVNGNVGIGVTSPARSLHISDTMRLQPRSSPPPSPSLGDLYVDSDSNELCFYNGSSWTGIQAGGSCS